MFYSRLLCFVLTAGHQHPVADTHCPVAMMLSVDGFVMDSLIVNKDFPFPATVDQVHAHQTIQFTRMRSHFKKRCCFF